MRNAISILLALLSFAAFATGQTAETRLDPARSHRSLAGEWTLALDPQDEGESAHWFASDLPANPIALPGTTDLAGKGYALDESTMTYPVEFLDSTWPGRGAVERLDESGHLVRKHMYIGKAWYQRTIDVPPAWAERHVQLLLERVCWGTKVWLDDRFVGEHDSLVAEHRFDVGPLAPGPHRLTVLVDNGLVHDIGIIGHAYGPETQSRWNGIVGRIELIVTDPVYLAGVQVYPAPDRGSVRVKARIANATGIPQSGTLSLAVRDDAGREEYGASDFVVELTPGEQVLERIFTLERPARGWNEFAPLRYTLVAEVRTGELRDEVRETFGFRHVRRDGRHVLVDGERIFLRGTLDCCVYPRTGHPPTSVEEWLEVLGTIRDHGFNHVRFHTWCPPEAAFEAADRLGVYLAPETPFWVDNWTAGLGLKPDLIGADDSITDWVRAEIRRISEAYGNHPSFTFFCIGNEFGMSSDWELVNDVLAEAKREDPRHIYNATTARKAVASDDFWVTHRTDVGVRGIGPSHTNWDFSAGTACTDLPVVSHETGQRPVFPDYDVLLSKFTGPLAPHNYVRLRDELAAAGMADQVQDFERASARFQLVQYKAEHEAFHRTPDLLGYQLLMLNDFTGQSEALVGILDPFWEPKGVVSVEQVRRWNAPTVVLARFDRFTWTSDETFTAEIEVAHYGPEDLPEQEIRWSLFMPDRQVLRTGVLPSQNVPRGGFTRLGRVEVPLTAVEEATPVDFSVSVGDIWNRWNLWVYPPLGDETDAGDVLVADGFDDEARAALAEGRDVLLLVHGLQNENAKRTGFASVYWSAGWWGDRFSSLGILCDPEHPALAQFPNEGHSDWQWYELTEGATTIHLDGAPWDYRPIVQPVTDFHHNRLLGHVFETRVGEGRLLVCGYDLTTDLENRHAARQLRRSLLAYMGSDAFQPPHALDPVLLKRWLAPPAEAHWITVDAKTLDAAALHVKAATRLESRNQDVPWSRENDEIVRTADGYSWSVAGGTWKDETGAAWHGNPLELTIDVPPGTAGDLLVHLHDWNGLDRRGTVSIEGPAEVIGEHAGEGSGTGSSSPPRPRRTGRSPSSPHRPPGPT